MSDLTEVLTRVSPERIIEKANDLFVQKFAGAALDNGLSATDWDHIQRAFAGGYAAGWAESQTSFLEALYRQGFRIVRAEQS